MCQPKPGMSCVTHAYTNQADAQQDVQLKAQFGYIDPAHSKHSEYLTALRNR